MVTAGEEKSLSRVKEKRTTKIEFVVKKSMCQTIFLPNIFLPCALKSRTAKRLFAVRPKNAHGKVSSARQRAIFP
jgi:hypothetical protein